MIEQETSPIFSRRRLHALVKAASTRIAATAIVTLAAVSQATDSSAGTVRPGYSMQDLLTASDAVVIATVVARQVIQAPAPGLATEETLTEIHVRRYLRGSGPAIRIVRQLGDTTGQSSNRLASDARLEVQHTCILFLRSDAERGVDHLTLLGFSAYELRGQLASPHAELPEPAAYARPRANDSSPPRLGRPAAFASLERFVAGATP